MSQHTIGGAGDPSCYPGVSERDDDQNEPSNVPMDETMRIDDDNDSVQEMSENPRIIGNTRQATMILSETSEDEARPARRREQLPYWSGMRFLITLNEVARWERLKAYLRKRNPKYIIAAQERAPTTGHEHIHCYVHFKKSQKLYKGKLQGCHVDKCKGTPRQCTDYVKKDGQIILEEGDEPAPDKKKFTIGNVKKATQEEIDEMPAQFVKQIEHIVRTSEDDEKPSYRDEPKITWLYGPTGTGKTRYCVEAGATMVTYNPQGFFSDWRKAKIIALEEMRGQVPFATLLQLGDFYQNYYYVNIKGDFKKVNIDRLLITSPMSPKDCYPNLTNEQFTQLTRRIKEVIYTGQQAEVNPNADLNN